LIVGGASKERIHCKNFQKCFLKEFMYEEAP